MKKKQQHYQWVHNKKTSDSSNQDPTASWRRTDRGRCFCTCCNETESPAILLERYHADYNQPCCTARHSGESPVRCTWEWCSRPRYSIQQTQSLRSISNSSKHMQNQQRLARGGRVVHHACQEKEKKEQKENLWSTVLLHVCSSSIPHFLCIKTSITKSTYRRNYNTQQYWPLFVQLLCLTGWDPHVLIGLLPSPIPWTVAPIAQHRDQHLLLNRGG